MSTLVFLVCLPFLILSNILDRRDLKESDFNFLNLARTFHLFSLPKKPSIYTMFFSSFMDGKFFNDIVSRVFSSLWFYLQLELQEEVQSGLIPGAKH